MKTYSTFITEATAAQSGMRIPGGQLLRGAGRLASRAAAPVGAAIDAKDEYEQRRKAGFNQAQSGTAAALKAGGGWAGGAVGAAKGAALGAALGSVVPGAGTAIGAGLGGIAGGIAGYMGGSALGGKAADLAVGSSAEKAKQAQLKIQQQMKQNQQKQQQQQKNIQRQTVAAAGGRSGQVQTNTAYQSKLGGAKATTTYGAGGQQVVRANLGNQGANKVAQGGAQAGKAYGATLGGVKGTVTYDAKGNKSFQATKPAAKPVAKPTPKPVAKPTAQQQMRQRIQANKPKPAPQQKKMFGLF
ncbi:MAG: hypothetical protein ACO23I_05755 [Candidatus Nanopelagicales bacterium]